jgi:SAM-dependent methyltransferase
MLNASMASLYGPWARLYHCVSQDRDFAAQSAFILEQIGTRPASVLELFAGPAYHGRHLAKTADVTVHCVDASKQMKRLACEDGGIRPSAYSVGHLPAALLRFARGTKFNSILALRYSLGYIPFEELTVLMRLLVNLLRPNGVILIELHNLVSLLGGLVDLEIRERVIPLGGDRRLVCTWPSGPLRWRRQDWVVDMPVRFEYRNGTRTTRVINFISTEWIYTVNYLRREIQRLGGLKLKLVAGANGRAFPACELVIIRRTSV